MCLDLTDSNVFSGLPEVDDPDTFWSDEVRNATEVRIPNHRDQATMYPCRNKMSHCGRTNDVLPMIFCVRKEWPISGMYII
jgi:hypothetical protein